MLSDYIDQLPEDKREAFKAEISKAVVIATPEDAVKLLESNDLIKKTNQANQDRRYAEMVKKFEAEKVPELVRAELAKGQKQPWEIEIENLKKENETARNEGLREKQKNRALAKAQELGIPASLIDPYLGLTDEETDAKLKTLIDTVVPYRENAVKEALKNVGSQPKPQGGKAETDNLAAQYDAAIKNGNMAQAIAIKDQMSRAS
jgi:hypothetical protein